MSHWKFIAVAVVIGLSSGSVMAADNTAAKAPQNAERVYSAKTPKLTRAQFDVLLAKPEGLTVIDVRRPDELISNGSFPAFLSIQTSDIEKNAAYIPRDRSIVTVSNHAHRAGAAGDLLVSKGFKVVGAVGSLDYEAEGGAISRITKPSPVAQLSSTQK